MRPSESMLKKRDAIWQRHGRFLPFAPPLEVKRTRNGKTFWLGGDEFHTSTSIGAVHYYDNGWQEIDTAVENFQCTKVPYECYARPDEVSWTYISREGGGMTMTLEEVNGQPVDYSNMTARYEGSTVFWDNVAPGVDIKLCMYRSGVEDFKRLLAPTELTWRVQKSNFQGKFQTELHGYDREGDALEVLTWMDGDRFHEKWTGRASEITDRKTRRKRWKRKPRTPVMVDASISESISAGVDDGGEGTGTSWYSTGTTLAVGHTEYTTPFPFNAGLRWRTIAIPSGSTISAATVTVNITNVNSPGGAKLYGDDVDDAALWANGNLPSGITKTTANVAITPVATGTGYTVDVQGVVAEILGRAGWSENNDLRVGILHQLTTGGSESFNMEAFEAAGTDDAQLDVTYTVASGQKNLLLLGVGA